MEFLKHSLTEYAIQLDDMRLIMSRVEAEELFVSIGHLLQDDDIAKYDENGSTEQQPTI